MIQLKELCKNFIDGGDKVTVLDHLNLSLEQGHSAAIRGESGSGKSTLLHILATLEKPDAGEVMIDQQSIVNFSEQQADQFRQYHLGIVFQRFNLIDCLSVWDNVAFPAHLNKNYDPAYIKGLLEQLNILPHQHKMPLNLSGGEQQRVAIARALAHKPALILADEPTGNLDEGNSEVVNQLLFELCKTLNTTLIVVTHSPRLAASADHHYLLHNGKLVASHA